jgi:hypothetical protein
VQRQQLSEAAGVLPAVAAALADDSPAIAEAAADVMVALAGGTVFTSSSARALAPAPARVGSRPLSQRPPARTPQAAAPGELAAVADAVAQLSEAPAAADATVRARVLALVARVAGAHDAAFTAVDARGLLSHLLTAAADTDDVLLQLNVLELLPPLAHSRRGFDSIVSAGIVDRLLAWSGVDAAASAGAVVDDAVEGANPLLGSASLTTLAEIYAAGLQLRAADNLRPRVLPGLAAVVTQRCAAGMASSDALRAVDALVTLMAVDVAAVDHVLAQRDLTREWLENGVSSTPELRLAALAGLARVLHGATAAVAAWVASGGGVAGVAPPAAQRAGADAPQPGFERYRDLFERLGEHCGKDSVEVCLRCLKLVRASSLSFALLVCGWPHLCTPRRRCSSQKPCHFCGAYSLSWPLRRPSTLPLPSPPAAGG